MFEPLTKQTIVENIIGVILDMVSKGEISPGDKLPSERDLATMLNVSRTSVREALKALSFTGVVVVKPGVGTCLSNQAISKQSALRSGDDSVLLKHRSDFKQVTEARRILETEMAVLAASRATPEEVAELEQSVSHMQELLREEIYDAYTMEDMSFHNLIAKCCQNEYLYRAYSAIWPNIVDITLLGATVPNRHLPAYQQHVEILNAIKNYA